MDPRQPNQSTAPIPPQGPVPVTLPSAEKQRAKKIFIIVLITWLVSFPLAAIVQVMARFVWSSSDPLTSESSLLLIVNIFSILLGLYGILGWIPAIITGVIWGNKK